MSRWTPGWPGQDWTKPNVTVGGTEGRDVVMTMRLRDGLPQNVPGALWGTVLQKPAPGRAVVVMTKLWWSNVRGIVPTFWLRPNVWPADPATPPKPEMDLVEGLYTPDAVATISHRAPGEGLWLARWDVRPETWNTFVFKLTADRVNGWWCQGGKSCEGPVWWPAGGYALVAGMWAITREERFKDWDPAFKVAAGVDRDAVQWVRDTTAAETNA